MLVEYRTSLVFDLVEHQGQIAAVGKQPFLRKIRSLRLAQRTVTAERPLAERLDLLKLPSEPEEFRIKIRILALRQDGLIQRAFVRRGAEELEDFDEVRFPRCVRTDQDVQWLQFEELHIGGKRQQPTHTKPLDEHRIYPP